MRNVIVAVLVRLAECLSVTVDRLLSGNQATDKAAYYHSGELYGL
jgi:hypothetical protein